MSLSFSCPSCKVQIEVADELAGQTGQCPRCEHVFTIPSPMPKAAPPVAKAVPAAAKIPPSDPWDDEERRDRDRKRPRRAESDRPRRPRAPAEPRGPIWPWFVGVLGALVVVGLLFSSFIVLVAMRKPFTPIADLSLPPSPSKAYRVTAGRLDGQRAFLHNGVFQVRTALAPKDPVDLDNAFLRAKQFEVELVAQKTYAIEVDATQFDSVVRLERMHHVITRNGFFGARNSRIVYTPQDTHVFMVYVTSMNQTTGAFTLTIREQAVPKPMAP